MVLPVLTGLYAHYEADTLGLANGASVTTWPDLSGIGNDLNTTGSTVPTYETNSLNGMGGVVFTGAHNIRDATLGGTPPTTRTVFLVVENPPNDGSIKYMSEGIGNALIMSKWSNADRWIFGTSSSANQFIEFTETGIVGVAGIWSYVHQATGAFLRWNQAQKVSGNITTIDAPTRINLGSPGNSGTGFTVYEYIIYSGALSGGDIDLVEDYLFTKWFVAPAPPDAPGNPSATAEDADSILVEWDDVADETGFRVERSANGTTGWADVSGNLGVGVLSYQDTGLACATQYFYRVYAFNAVGDSAASTVVNATTSACVSPTGQKVLRSPRYGLTRSHRQ